MAALSNYLENKLIDFALRGQPFTPPASTYVGLLTASPNDDNSGTASSEVSTVGSGYGRVAIACNLNAWAGTQGAGTTVASSGTSGTTSNNAAATFGAPTSNWGVITHMGVYDALTGGNLLFYAALNTPKTINSGDAAPSFAAGDLQFQIDN